MDQNNSHKELLKFTKTLIILVICLAIYLFVIAKINETEISSLFWLCIFFLFFSIIAYTSLLKKNKIIDIENNNFKKIKYSGYLKENFIVLQKYLGGIPGFDRTNITYKLYPTKTGFDVFNSSYDKLGSINNSEIMDVIIEDKRQISKRLSIVNIALFGPLGLAMRKSQELDVSLLILKLNDGRFSHEGVFSFEYTKEDKMQIGGKNLDSYNDALKARNSIINHLKSL